MADIKVRKRKPSVWPWLFTLVILGLIVAGIVFLFNNTRGNSMKDKVSGVKEDFQSGKLKEDLKSGKDKVADKVNMGKEKINSYQQGNEQPKEIKNFVSFAEDSTPTKGKENLYASKGLNQLADAIANVQQTQNIQDGQSVSELRRKAGKLKTDTSGVAIKDAFNSATQAMENIQEKGFPDKKDQIQSLKESVNQVSNEESISEQTDVVQDFFDNSASTLEEFASAKK